MSLPSIVIEQSDDQKSTAPQSRKDSWISQKDVTHDIEEVYKIIGFGRIQGVVLLTGGLYLLMVINETLGFSMVTIASQCDLHTNSVEKAILSSASFMGIFCSSYFWGYISDVIGRRKLLISTTLIGNLLSFVSMFVPTYWPFVVIRFFVGCFIAGASSTTYAYLGEFFTSYYRPIVINYASMFVGLSMMYFPAISWLILSMNWSLHISDEFLFRPWRLIILCYMLPGLIANLILLWLPESPKFFLSIYNDEKAYEAVDWICRHSKGRRSLEDMNIFKITMEMDNPASKHDLTNNNSNILVKLWRETSPLFKRPHVLYFLISCIGMLGLFMSSSGMGVWYPTIQNRVGASELSKDFNTVCQILAESSPSSNNTSKECNDTITANSFIDSITLGVAYVVGYIILGVILNPVGRKTILIVCLGLSGVFALVLLWIKEPIAIVVSFGVFLVLPGLSISVLSGAVVDLVPTYLRGKAVCICLMLGRSGSVIGSNLIGALLETHCTLTFGIFSGFGLLCAGLMFILPI